MWKNIKDSEYYLSFKHENDYEICVTDYLAVWTILYSKKAFIAQLKDSNKTLRFQNVEDYVTKGVYLLTNTDQLTKVNIKKEENGQLFMSLKIRIANRFLFCFECKLTKGSDKFYFEKITQPLLKSVSELHTSQKELRHKLECKDLEINEYRFECGVQKLIQEHLNTEPFNDKDYMKKFKSYEECFGDTEIPASLLEKSFKNEQNNIKHEEEYTAVPSLKQVPAMVSTVKHELNSVPTLNQEPQNIIQESIQIKSEPHTPVLEDTPSLPVLPVSCKQEAMKRELPSSQTKNISSRKKFKKLSLKGL